MKPHTLPFLLFLFTMTSFAQDNVPVLYPIADLPNAVETKTGSIRVFVNWEPRENGLVDVYVVNRSDKPVELAHAYGSVYLKLEALNRDEKWERTEPHSDEICGTGLGSFVLKPGHWLKQVHSINFKAPAKVDPAPLRQEIQKTKDFMARARLTKQAYDEHIARIKSLESRLERIEASTWEKRTVRLRIYDRNSRAESNSGTAFVSLPGIQQAKEDVFSIRFANTERLRALLSGKEVLSTPHLLNGPPFNPKHTALYTLATQNHAIEDAIDIFNSVIANDEDSKTVELAERLLAELKKKSLSNQ